MDRAQLSNPWRLLPTLFPWRCLAYLAIVTVAGMLTWASMSTVVLFPVWAAVWGRLDRRAVVLVGKDPLPAPPHGLGVTWRDLVHALVSAPLAVLGVLSAVGLATLASATVLAPLQTRGDLGLLWTATWSTPLSSAIAVITGVLLLPLVGCLVMIMAVGVGHLNAAILSRRAEDLEAQVESLNTASLRVQDNLILERRLLQQRLHDGAQLHLSVTGTHLALLELAADGLPDGAERTRIISAVEGVRENVQAAMDEIRSAAQGLTPRLLVEEGLCAALHSLTSGLSMHTTLTCEVSRLNEPVETDLYLVISEALTNVVKHSSAQHVTVQVEADHDVVVAEISDDGAGGADPNGSGLMGMTARAERHGGTLQLISREGDGTHVTIRLPRGAT